MTIADDLINRGYFPRELPPCFITSQLAGLVAADGLQNINGAYSGGDWTRPSRHNLARPGGLRRVLSTPNPINFLRLTDAIERAWLPHIQPCLNLTTIATSTPVASLGPRAWAPSLATAMAERQALSRAGCRYLLKADIQNFYPSIYTHSISWALHGKAFAKAHRRTATLAGNEIDKAIREGQDGHTMGIPIGPDSSWAIAECVLARSEDHLRRTISHFRGHRYNDDFELGFVSIGEAEQALCALQAILSDFELSLNPLKTRIVELPTVVQSEGISELRQWTFRPGARAQRSDIIDYFDRLAQLIVANRGGHTASYAVARLRTESFLPTSWSLIEASLFQLLVAEPYSARQVAMTISMLASVGHTVSASALRQAAEALITRHAGLGHGSEVSWALWLSIAHGVSLTQDSADAVSTMDDDFVALLALHAKTHSLVTGQLDTTRWENLMTGDDLRGTNWLLSYEARLKGWLPSKNTANHLTAEPFFEYLHTRGISFYDVNGFVLSYQPHQILSSGGGGGVGGPY